LELTSVFRVIIRYLQRLAVNRRVCSPLVAAAYAYMCMHMNLYSYGEHIYE